MSRIIWTEIGAAIKHQMLIVGMSKEELARKLGFSIGRTYQVLNGSKTIGLDNLSLICDAVGIKLSDLIMNYESNLFVEEESSGD